MKPDLRKVPGLRVPHSCAICGEQFPAVAWQLRQGYGTTCSKACGVALRARSLLRGETRPCPICGTDFWVQPYKTRTARTPTCSEACQGVARSRRYAQERQVVNRTCPVCGETYTSSATELRRGEKQNCSRACFEKSRSIHARAPRARRTTAEHRREKKRLKDRSYRERHRESYARRQATYARDHRDLWNLAQQRRRARQAAAPVNDLTRGQWRAIKAAFGNRCAYCGEHFERLTMDHVVALVNGGSHTASNVVPACRSCNCRKGTTSILPTFLPEHPVDLRAI